MLLTTNFEMTDRRMSAQDVGSGIMIYLNIFSCRTKSAAALGTTFGLLLLLLLLLLSVISKIFVNSISSYCNYSQFCFYLAMLGHCIKVGAIQQTEFEPFLNAFISTSPQVLTKCSEERKVLISSFGMIMCGTKKP